MRADEARLARPARGGAATVDLATVDADASGAWTVTVTVPPDAVEGEPTIRVDPAEDAVVAVAHP